MVNIQKKSNEDKIWQMGEGQVGKGMSIVFKIKEEKEYNYLKEENEYKYLGIWFSE